MPGLGPLYADTPFEPPHFERIDPSDDAGFYAEPRLVAHIDEGAIAALTAHYAAVLPPRGRVLDLMSSWISHLPEGYEGSRIAGLGMNAAEMERNPVLDDWTVHDLNADPNLPFGDAEFDAVLIAVSVQYLRRPLEVFREIGRVLDEDGICAVSFSNRCFPTKAVRIWQGLDDAGHVQLAGAYFHYSRAFEPPQWFDLSPRPGAPPGTADPLFAVQARKRRNGQAGRDSATGGTGRGRDAADGS